jgi:predicted AlkP superfamily phosphohydrolase/phosphomutase
MTARLLMVALDGADGRTLERCCADGSLPQLAALAAQGRTRRLSAMPGITDDALWASFQYATEIGGHGRYYYEIPLRDGRIGMAHCEESARSFWEELSESGLRVAIIDVPKCGAAREINGLHLVDWLVHGRYFHDPQSYPPNLVAEVLDRFGPAPPSQCGYELPPLTDDEVRETVGNLRAGVAKKRAAALHYLAAGAWDLFILGFKEAHCASHAFWDLADVRHPAHDPARRSALGDPVMAILQDIDVAIGDLVAAAGPACEVVVFATTDFEPNGSLDHLMPQVVERLNRQLAGSRAGMIQRFLAGLGFADADGPCEILPYNENWVALRVNARSRMGLSRRHREASPSPRLLEAIEGELLKLRDAETGQSVVSAITRPSSELEGSRALSLPDLLIQCASGALPRVLVSPSLGRIEAESAPMRTGNHVAGGFLVARGAAAATAAASVHTMADLGSLAEAVLWRPGG